VHHSGVFLRFWISLSISLFVDILFVPRVYWTGFSGQTTTSICVGLGNGLGLGPVS
jgi:hypothetical protein